MLDPPPLPALRSWCLHPSPPCRLLTVTNWVLWEGDSEPKFSGQDVSKGIPLGFTAVEGSIRKHIGQRQK